MLRHTSQANQSWPPLPPHICSVSKFSLCYLSLATSHHPIATTLIQGTITFHLDYCRSLMDGLPAFSLPHQFQHSSQGSIITHSHIMSLLCLSAQPHPDLCEWVSVTFLTSFIIPAFIFCTPALWTPLSSSNRLDKPA